MFLHSRRFEGSTIERIPLIRRLVTWVMIPMNSLRDCESGTRGGQQSRGCSPRPDTGGACCCAAVTEVAGLVHSVKRKQALLGSNLPRNSRVEGSE